MSLLDISLIANFFPKKLLLSEAASCFRTQLSPSPKLADINLITQVHVLSTAIWLYLGFGMSSSGTGVQIDSGDFCSLNLPSNTAASCSMSKAHTAEPGMLERRRQDGERERQIKHFELTQNDCQPHGKQALLPCEVAERKSDRKGKDNGLYIHPTKSLQ